MHDMRALFDPDSSGESVAAPSNVICGQDMDRVYPSRADVERGIAGLDESLDLCPYQPSFMRDRS